MGCVCIVGAWVRGWRESNFGRGRVGRVGPQSFGAGQKKMAGVEILVWVKHDFTNFCYDFMKFYCFKLIILVSSLYFLHILYLNLPINSYFIEKVLFPKIKRLNQYLKSY